MRDVNSLNYIKLIPRNRAFLWQTKIVIIKLKMVIIYQIGILKKMERLQN